MPRPIAPETAIPPQTIPVHGPSQEVEILIDRWGVPHIYAKTQGDAFFGQGFAVARDRLWQIDLWRKRGLGLLSADYGAEFVPADRAARLLLYRGDMAAEWAVYGEGAKDFAAAFTAGINAYVDLVLNDPSKLPIEFQRTGTRPAYWQAEDVVRIRSHGPMASFGREMKRAQTLSRHGAEAEDLRCKLEPAWTLVPPKGIAAEEIPPEVQKVFDLGTLHTFFAAPNSETPPDGSNNWVVAPSRTETGRPILANDPHRVLLLPSLRYVSHLVAPGLNVIGAGEPALPGISIGHNQTSAFGLTIHFADQSDLYVYETSPEDPGLYRFGDTWERMELIEEDIPIKGAAPQKVTLAFTRHGPVLHADPARRRAWALRSIWSEPGAAAYFASLRYMGAGSWQEFVEARSHWLTPSVNHVYADTSGDIGWIMSGAVPHRPGRDGLVPLPGDGSEDWQGWLPEAEKPRLYNPKQGWIATANEQNLPPDFDVARHKTNFEWADSSRYDAIARELAKDAQHSVEASCHLQTSFANPAAEKLVALLPGSNLQGPPGAVPVALSEAAREPAALLSAWDGVLDAESAAALLFELWHRRHLIPAVCEAIAPGAFPDWQAAHLAEVSAQRVLEILSQPDPRLGADPVAARDDLISKTLAAAFSEAKALAGEDVAHWRWGDLHHMRFTHPLAARLQDPVLNIRPVRKGGSGLTPNAAVYDPTSFGMTSGASFRMVLDVGNWDAGLFVNAPGQSGDPLSRHYDDHLTPWSEESYLPLLYSRKAVEEAAVQRLVLAPQLKA